MRSWKVSGKSVLMARLSFKDSGMRKRRLWPCWLALPLLISPGSLQALPRPAVSLSLGQHYGHTTYHISFRQIEDGAVYTLESELEFPLGFWMGGLEISMGKEGNHRGRWSLVGAIRRNVSDPQNPMKDSDWIPIPPNIPRWLYSYTESRAEPRAWHIETEAGYCLLEGEAMILTALAGYRYHRVSYGIFGLQGWQNDGSGRQEYGLDPGLNVLDYRVSYHLPVMGFEARVRASNRMAVDVAARFSPYAYAEDLDDHLLRFKRSEATATGVAYFADLAVRADLPAWTERYRPFVRIRMGWSRIETDGHQTQRWYGDDPASPDFDDTGSSVAGIDDEITTESGFAEVHVGLGL
jgi:outer membrane protease